MGRLRTVCHQAAASVVVVRTFQAACLPSSEVGPSADPSFVDPSFVDPSLADPSLAIAASGPSWVIGSIVAAAAFA